jgi:hypothetical protein
MKKTQAYTNKWASGDLCAPTCNPQRVFLMYKDAWHPHHHQVRPLNMWLAYIIKSWSKSDMNASFKRCTEKLANQVL